jgi:hypothetical protein
MKTYNRPAKIFTAIVEMAEGLQLITVRAHDGAHAKKLATAQIRRETQGVGWHRVKLVLRGTAQVAT